MCGICGIVSFAGGSPDLKILRSMRDSLSHRGPDDEGEFSGGPIALGFRRLSILDIERGHQPMLSSDGNEAVVFNGEIYNHPLLKEELEKKGAKYGTRSDTETIIHLYRSGGPDFLKRLRGMFALALWDAKKRELIIARDPLGIKPVYYTVYGNSFFFSSELRSLLKCGAGTAVSPPAFFDYLRYGFVHSPLTIIGGVHKLPPGHFLKISLSSGNPPALKTERFHALTASDGFDSGMGEDELLSRLDALLNESVRSHCLSDVPVGAFLSGGVDSSLVTALMCRHAAGKVKTFSIGFSGAGRGMDESRFARRTADFLGTEHSELILPATLLENVSDCLLCLDEPIADSAVLPTYLLARHARNSVKVVLSGEGGDELFAGYGRYKAAYMSYKILRMRGLPARIAAFAVRNLHKGKTFGRVPIHSVAEWAEAQTHSPDETIKNYVSPEIRTAFEENAPPLWLDFLESNGGFNGMLAFDVRTVLSDCLLMKVDKTTMRASLEARVPFLGQDLADFALRIPPEAKIRFWKSKWVLRKLARRYLPPDITDRPKHGFWTPWEKWIRSANPGLDHALNAAALRNLGILNRETVREGLDSVRQSRPGSDSGLFYRIAVFALWHQSLQ